MFQRLTFAIVLVSAFLCSACDLSSSNISSRSVLSGESLELRESTITHKESYSSETNEPVSSPVTHSSEYSKEYSSECGTEAINSEVTSEKNEIDDDSTSLMVSEELSLTFNRSSEDAFVFSGNASFELDTSLSKDYFIEGDVLRVNGGGSFSFTLSEPVKDISIRIENDLESNRVSVGFVNKSGIQVLYDPTITSTEIYHSYKSSQTVTHVLLETAGELRISSIKMTLK